MKYDLKTILILVSIFFVTQLVGLGILYNSIEVEVVEGVKQVKYEETVLGPRPELYGWETFAWTVSAITISTALILIIIKLRKINWWKVLFFTSIFVTIYLAIGTLIEPIFAYIIAFLFALIKVLKPNVIIHNITEVLMYSGIAVFLVPLFDIKWILVLLFAISLYDVYAVLKSKHMVKMAEFQMKSRVFAGILIPLKSVKKVRGKKVKGKKITQAIIGGGDVAFPLLFSGVVMEGLIKSVQLTKEIAFIKTLIIPLFVSLTLLFLLIKGKEGKFYPAMPFFTAGCLISYVIISFL